LSAFGGFCARTLKENEKEILRALCRRQAAEPLGGVFR